ncbi:MAG: helix-turn-helix domain-containing protein [Deltaproteobacteria bacterium]|nr:helix-turn-helix domain-containing protein [Deltaproteobacteria bacterium]
MTTGQKINEKELKRRKGAQSIYRTIDLLRTLAACNEAGINLSDLATKNSLPVATVHRIVSVE